MSKPRILCDLDGCITDFDSGACRAHGITLEEMNKHRKLGEWSIVRPMGLALGIDNFTEHDFYEPIHKLGESFWLGLQLLPHAHELLALLDKYSDDWYIVTSPIRGTSSYVGKHKWLKRFFGQEFERFEITKHKYLMANPNTILIDDNGASCQKFYDNGGRALAFPTLGNQFHYYVKDPIGYVSSGIELAIKELQRCI